MRFAPSPPPAPPGIPRIIHQIWLGPSPLPPRWAEFGEDLRALHPGWEYRLWTDADVPALWDRHPPGWARLFHLWANFGYQSDILRLLILHERGGVYLDTDVEVLRPLDGLTAAADAFVGATFPGQPFPQVLIENAVLGAAPRHPWLSLTVRRLREGLTAMGHSAETRAAAQADKMHILDLTGPGLLSKTLSEYRGTRASFASDVAVLPARLLFPAGPGRDGAPGVFQNAYLRHHWDNSWGKQSL